MMLNIIQDSFPLKRYWPKRKEVFTLPDFAWVNIPASNVRAIFRNVSYQETKYASVKPKQSRAWLWGRWSQQGSHPDPESAASLTPAWANPPSQAAQGEQSCWSHGKPHQLLKKEQHYWKNVIQAVVNLSGLGLRQQKIPLTSSKHTKNSTWFFLKPA